VTPAAAAILVVRIVVRTLVLAGLRIGLRFMVTS
jgi:hypothetical protein